MIKSLAKLALVTSLALSASGCIIVAHDGDWSDDDWRQTQKDNRRLISGLEINTPRSEIIEKMGSPSISEAFNKDGNDYMVLYYRTQHRHSDNETTKDETTPLVFKNDKLIGWGENSLSLVE